MGIETLHRVIEIKEQLNRIENQLNIKQMEVKIKRLHPDAIVPTYAKMGDAGLDLTAVSVTHDDRGYLVYGTGLAVEIPQGFVGLVFPRSSIASKDLILSNSVGVIDSGYRGEIMAKFICGSPGCGREYSVGERIAQMIILPYPTIKFVEVDELSDSERGAGGYGSTGK